MQRAIDVESRRNAGDEHQIRLPGSFHESRIKVLQVLIGLICEEAVCLSALRKADIGGLQQQDRINGSLVHPVRQLQQLVFRIEIRLVHEEDAASRRGSVGSFS